MNILLLNGGKSFGHSHGRLNATLHEMLPKKPLSGLGHVIQETVIDAGYDIETEIEKYLWADAIVYEMPGWWMGEPWIVKKYIDEGFTIGHGQALCQRWPQPPRCGKKKYGSGGLLQGRKHMLSLTWNAPLEAFIEPDQFFNGTGVDNVYMHFPPRQ